jgi:hypothetical protein
VKIDFQKRQSNAFCRLELFFCLLATALLLVAIVPGLAGAGRRSDRLVCVDNLRQIGRAVQAWAFDHQDLNPWACPISSGGTRPTGGAIKLGAAWFEFTTISNELVTPALLVCPTDARRSVSRSSDWSTSPEGGYVNSKYRNNATSYTIGLHSGVEAPRSLVSSDRNLRPDATGVSCSFGIVGAVSITASVQTQVAWTNDLHGVFGNLLLNDGSLLQTSSAGLRSYFISGSLDNSGALHLLMP